MILLGSYWMLSKLLIFNVLILLWVYNLANVLLWYLMLNHLLLVLDLLLWELDFLDIILILEGLLVCLRLYLKIRLCLL